MTTFATILADQLRRDPGRPLVTFYDHATGERTELSVATYANWVAKTASLLAEEHDLERGQLLRADLLVLQRLDPGEASLIGQALGLGDVADWLTRMRPDMIGLVNRQSVRWAVLAQTPLEHQLIGSAERAAAASVT